MADPLRVDSPDVPDAVPGLFSNAVVCDGIVYISGQHAGTPDGVAGETMYDQTREALRRVVALAEAAGSAGDRIVKVTIFVTDMSRKDEVGRARKEAFAGALPAATLVEVSGFVSPALLVEIEAVAHI